MAVLKTVDAVPWPASPVTSTKIDTSVEPNPSVALMMDPVVDHFPE
jgi:hypothetical protein